MAERNVYPKIVPGKRFGRLTVLAEVIRHSPQGWRKIYWRCRCDCGTVKEAQQGALNLGITLSCGCLRKERFSDYRESQELKTFEQITDGHRRFGRLVVSGDVSEVARDSAYMIECRCDCGNSKSVFVYSLLDGISNSCGCLRVETTKKRATTHGHTKGDGRTAEYAAWSDAKSRCYNSNVRNYSEYGGRGIEMCEEWRNSFEAFYAYMGDRPSLIHSLDRIDANGNYEPGNCRWATDKEQCRNTRFNRVLEVDGQRMTLIEASERYGIKRATIWQRLNSGWSVDDAVKRPIRISGRWH